MFNLEFLILERVVKIFIGCVLGLISVNLDVFVFNIMNCFILFVFWEI